jgi:hypothetical protein
VRLPGRTGRSVANYQSTLRPRQPDASQTGRTSCRSHCVLPEWPMI